MKRIFISICVMAIVALTGLAIANHFNHPVGPRYELTYTNNYTELDRSLGSRGVIMFPVDYWTDSDMWYLRGRLTSVNSTLIGTTTLRLYLGGPPTSINSTFIKTLSGNKNMRAYLSGAHIIISGKEEPSYPIDKLLGKKVQMLAHIDNDVMKVKYLFYKTEFSLW